MFERKPNISPHPNKEIGPWKEGIKIELEAHRPPVPVMAPQPVVQSVPTTAPVAVQPSAPAVPPGEPKITFKEVVSPMVGTFYRAPSPDSAPYVQVGQDITDDTVVCIIEAMKVMNEIKAEVQGVIAEVLVENGTPVQFGQPLFRVK